MKKNWQQFLVLASGHIHATFVLGISPLIEGKGLTYAGLLSHGKWPD
jgi:hypothetical protein